MSDDAFWALVNAAVMVVALAGYAVVLWLNARANRRQLAHLEQRSALPQEEN